MSPGQALAAARHEAGLTVAEVSQKTRIREAIIRSIEQDDYSACGGDFYARGHIRAMARAAGADPAPLIREYDAARRGPGHDPDASDNTDQFPAIRGPFEPPIAAPAKPKAAFSSLGNFQLVDNRPDEAGPDHQAGWSHAGGGAYQPASDHQPPSDYGTSEAYEPIGSHDAFDSYEAPEVYGPPEAFAPSGAYGTEGAYEAAESYDELSEPIAAYGGTSGIGDTSGFGDSSGTSGIGDTSGFGDSSGSGAQGGPRGYRQVDELTRDFDTPYKFSPRFDPDGPHETPGGPRGLPGEPNGLPGEPHGRPGTPGGPYRAPGEAYERPGELDGVPGEPPSIGGDRSWFLGLTEPPVTGPPARPSGPARPARPVRPVTEPRRPGRWAAVTLVLLAALGLVAYLLLSSSGSTPSASSGSPSGKATGHQGGHSASPGHTTPPPASPSHSAPPPPQVLHPASAVAFGPSGAGQGDDPQDAGLAIDHAAGTYWQTDWYATAHFGNLQAGTGLLLDMGHPVTLTGVQVTLGAFRGADLQLRAGSVATLDGLRRVASAANAGGLVHLHPGAPVTARYLLIWFTKLPPNANGNFQVRVYNIKVL